MKKVQKKVSVLDTVLATVMGFLTNVVLYVTEFFGTVVDAVLSLGEGSQPVKLEPKKLEPKKPEQKVSAPVKQLKKSVVVEKPVVEKVVKKLTVVTPKKRSKK